MSLCSVRFALRRSVRKMTASAVREGDLLIAKDVGNKGVLILNRPKALNAINNEMQRKIAKQIEKWQNSKSMIIIKANGEKAFCAGGDVKENILDISVEHGKVNGKRLYTTNFQIGTLKIPYIALIDGIVMGGGGGISILGKYRVASERTIFALPEVAIGYFPDCGPTYYLQRIQGKLGYYLALTGSRLYGVDVWHFGLATHYCHSSKLPELENALLSLENSNDVERVLDEFCPVPKLESSISKYIDQINRSFDASTVEEIIHNLEKDDSEWAKQTLKILRSVSPTSLKVTLRALRLGENMSLGECLQLEYRLCCNIIGQHDYREGVTAMLIDKDKKPKWNPSRIEDVTDEMISYYFRPLPNNDQLPINVQLTSKL